MLRTAVNVTGDLTISTLVATGEKQIDLSIVNQSK